MLFGRQQPISARISKDGNPPSSPHLRMPSHTRIAVIGAGASGITAAYRLVRSGYASVTVFEREERVGGKVDTVSWQGRPHEMGAVFATRNYGEILSLAHEAGVETRPFQRPLKIVDTDGAVLDFEIFLKRHFSLSRIARSYASFYALLALNPSAFSPGLAHVASGFHQTFERFSREKGIEPLAELFRSTMVGCGYGFYEEIPAAYIMKLMRFWVRNSLSIAGHEALGLASSTLLTFPAGFQNLWETLARGLDVRLSAPVAAVRRTAGSISLRLRNEDVWQEFDRLIVSSPLAEAARFLDATPHEVRLFSRVATCSYAATLFMAEGLPRGQTLFFHGNARPEARGHAVILASFSPEENVWTAYQLAPQDVGSESLEGILADDVRSLGGRMTEVLARRNWSYFPHVSAGDLDAGFYEELESLQGENGTYYIGGVMNFESTEHTAAYASDLVRRFFVCPARQGGASPA